MKRAEIDARFTDVVIGYLEHGYTFKTNTMRGSQGEISKVDLEKGDDLIRVILDEKSAFMYIRCDIYRIIVGRVKEEEKLRFRGGYSDTIWNNKLEIVSEEQFYKIGDDYYVTEEEAKRAEAVNKQRWENRKPQYGGEKVEFPLEKAAPIVRPFVRRQKGFKHARLNEIEKVYKEIRKEVVRYFVVARGKNLEIQRYV